MEGENYRFIITGGPGSGISSLIRELAKSGYIIFTDIARHLMESGMEAPINMADPALGKRFSKLVTEERIQQHKAGEGSGICFYDRGLPDSAGFSKHLGKKPSEALTQAISQYRYNRNVFIMSPWKEIYTRDNIRKESFETASILYQHIKSAYIEAGYNLITIPKIPLEERLNYIEAKLPILDLLGNKPVGE